MFGDWTRLHAALNDLPVALLVASVVFDLLGALSKRASLKAAGFWCLIGGVIGGGLAALAGEMAEGRAAHDDAGHSLMETHETFAFVVLAFFAILMVWRLLRRGILGRQEQTIITTAGVIGIGLLLFTANLGGKLVFDHATGIDSHVLQKAIEERREGHAHEGDSVPPADSTRAVPHDSIPRTHQRP